MELEITRRWDMENKVKRSFEVGYFKVYSWEHRYCTGDLYCQNVNQLKWVLPNEQTRAIKQLLEIIERIELDNTFPIAPYNFPTNGYPIRIKSDAFKNRLPTDNLDFLCELLQATKFSFWSKHLDVHYKDTYESIIKGNNEGKFCLKLEDLIAVSSTSSWNEVVEHALKCEPDRPGECFKVFVPAASYSFTSQYNIIWHPLTEQPETLNEL